VNIARRLKVSFAAVGQLKALRFTNHKKQAQAGSHPLCNEKK